MCVLSVKIRKWKTSFLKTEDIPNYNDNIFNFMTSYRYHYNDIMVGLLYHIQYRRVI